MSTCRKRYTAIEREGGREGACAGVWAQQIIRLRAGQGVLSPYPPEPHSGPRSPTCFPPPPPPPAVDKEEQNGEWRQEMRWQVKKCPQKYPQGV